MKRRLKISMAAIAFMVLGYSVFAQRNVTYNFNTDLTGVVTAANGGSPAVGSLPLTPNPGTSRAIFDGVDQNLTAVLRHQTVSGLSNNTCVNDLTLFPSTADYSVTWKEYLNTLPNATTTSHRRGFLLRGQSVAATPYAPGFRNGYLFNLVGNAAGQIQFQIRNITGTSLTVLAQSSNINLNGGTTPISLDKAYYYRVSATGSNPVVLKFEYSLDGITFTTAVTHSDGSATRYANAGLTQTVTGIGFGSYTYHYLDNVKFNNLEPVTYYYKGTGLLTDVSSWGTNIDGSGDAPLDFTTSAQIFEIRNATSVALDGLWTVSGAGSKVRIGNASQPAITFTLNSGSSIGPVSSSNVDVVAPLSGNHTIVHKNSADLSYGAVTDPNLAIVFDGSIISSSNLNYTFGSVDITNSSFITYLHRPVIKKLTVDVTSVLTAPTGPTNAYITIPSGGSIVINGRLKIPQLTGFVKSAVGTASSTNGNIQFIGTENLTLGENSIVEYSGSGGNQIVDVRTDYKNLRFTGTASKNISSGTTVAGTITINQAAPVTLLGDLTVNSIVFTSGKITTGVHTLTIGASGTITGASSATGWVVGNLKKLTNSSASPSFTYTIGDATTYAPLDLTFSGNTSVAGGLTASTSLGDHPANGGSIINNSKSVNRIWTLKNDALSDFGIYTAGFSYASEDNDVNTSPTNYLVDLYNGATWSNLATSSPSSTTATAIGITDFGDFAIGECLNPTTTGSVTTSICAGSTYHWDANNTDYTSAQAGLTHTVGCNTATLNLTIIPAPHAGTSGTLSVTSSPSDADLFAALTGADAGGSWSRPNSGYIGEYTYTVSATSPCILDSKATVMVSAATVLPAANTTFNFCTGAKVSTLIAATGTGVKVYLAATGGVALGEIALTGTTLKPAVYFLTEPTANGESARVRVSVILNALPATPSALVLTNENAVLPATSATAVTAVGFYVGTDTPFKLTATAAGAVSYKWTLPTGVVRTDATGVSTDNSTTSVDGFIYVKFSPYSSNTPLPLVINVQSVNASGCTSAVKASASLTRLLPTAPTAITMTDASLPVAQGKLPVAITSFAKYMGTNTVLTLTATPSLTATSYVWELPEGVTQLTGGTSNVITVNFAGVTNSNTANYLDAKGISTNALRIGVKSVNGVGNSITANTAVLNPTTTSTAKLLTLTAVAPAAPASLAMNNGSNTTAITVISKMIGQGGTVKLVAAASVLASSYEWELPSCVTRVTDLDGLTADITSTSTDPFIYVKFNGSAPAAGSIYFGVKAVNGIGSSVNDNLAVTVIPTTTSKAKLLKLATVVPAAPATLAMNNGSNTTALTVISKMIGQGGTVKLLAAASVLANSYAWELPSCVTRVTDLEGLTAENTLTSTDPFIFVKFNGTAPAAGSIYFGVQAVNGIGSSVTDNSATTVIPTTTSKAKLLKLATVVPAAPATLVLNDLASAKPTTAIATVGKYIGTTTKLKLTAGVSALANTFEWTLPEGVNRVDESGNPLNGTSSTESFIYVNFKDVPAVATSLLLGVKAKNDIGSSVSVNTGANSARTDKLLIITATLPAVVATVSGSASVCNRAEGFSYTITAPAEATYYVITAPAGSVVSSTNGVAGASSNVFTTSDLTFKVVYNGTVPFSTADNKLVIRSANAVGLCATTKSIALTKQATCTSLVAIGRLAAPSVSEEFDVIAYPNPTSDVFTLEVQSSAKRNATTELQVYDMTGRLIEQRQVESNSIEVGNNYPTGVYNVIVNQGENTKTLRVIKK